MLLLWHRFCIQAAFQRPDRAPPPPYFGVRWVTVGREALRDDWSWVRCGSLLARCGSLLVPWASVLELGIDFLGSWTQNFVSRFFVLGLKC